MGELAKDNGEKIELLSKEEIDCAIKIKKIKKLSLLAFILILIISNSMLYNKIIVNAQTQKTLTLKVGDKITLTISGDGKKSTYSSSNSNIATVSNKGEVVGKELENCSIIVKTEDKIVNYKVTVKGNDKDEKLTKEILVKYEWANEYFDIPYNYKFYDDDTYISIYTSPVFNLQYEEYGTYSLSNGILTMKPVNFRKEISKDKWEYVYKEANKQEIKVGSNKDKNSNIYINASRILTLNRTNEIWKQNNNSKFTWSEYKKEFEKAGIKYKNNISKKLYGQWKRKYTANGTEITEIIELKETGRFMQMLNSSGALYCNAYGKYYVKDNALYLVMPKGIATSNGMIMIPENKNVQIIKLNNPEISSDGNTLYLTIIIDNISYLISYLRTEI